MARIAVYADWEGLQTPLRLGVLHAQRGAGREIFEFAFDAAALAHPAVLNLHLDPRLGLFEGRQLHPTAMRRSAFFLIPARTAGVAS